MRFLKTLIIIVFGHTNENHNTSKKDHPVGWSFLLALLRKYKIATP